MLSAAGLIGRPSSVMYSRDKSLVHEIQEHGCFIRQGACIGPHAARRVSRAWQ